MSQNTTKYAFIDLEALVIRHKNLFEIEHTVVEEHCFCCINYRAKITIQFKVKRRWTTTYGCGCDPITALNWASEELLPLVNRYIELHSEPVVEAREITFDKS